MCLTDRMKGHVRRLWGVALRSFRAWRSLKKRGKRVRKRQKETRTALRRIRRRRGERGNHPERGVNDSKGFQFLDLRPTLPYLWLARNEGMDSFSGPCITYYSSFHFLVHSFISYPKASYTPTKTSRHRCGTAGCSQTPRALSRHLWPKSFKKSEKCRPQSNPMFSSLKFLDHFTVT